jgi:hypothetical protein
MLSDGLSPGATPRANRTEGEVTQGGDDGTFPSVLTAGVLSAQPCRFLKGLRQKRKFFIVVLKIKPRLTPLSSTRLVLRHELICHPAHTVREAAYLTQK